MPYKLEKGGVFFMAERKVTFLTYEKLVEQFKDRCNLDSVSLSEALNKLIEDYLAGSLGSLDDLKKCLLATHNTVEKKTYKLTVYLNESNYERLKMSLGSGAVRPATVLTFLLAYAVVREPDEADYVQKANMLLEVLPKDVRHVVYGLKFYRPVEDHVEFVAKTYGIDVCSEERFKDYYSTLSPLVEVLAVHRNDIKEK